MAHLLETGILMINLMLSAQRLTINLWTDLKCKPRQITGMR